MKCDLPVSMNQIVAGPKFPAHLILRKHLKRHIKDVLLITILLRIIPKSDVVFENIVKIGEPVRMDEKLFSEAFRIYSLRWYTVEN